MKDPVVVEQEQGERMIPFSAVAPLLGRITELIEHDPRPDSRMVVHYDELARYLGCATTKELLSL